jgi:dolichol-phosphate mannosyltransferase
LAPHYSIVVPVFNEEENIQPFYDALCNHIPADFELIWVNDGSTDKTLPVIKSLAAKDYRIRCISFSRNFGHQAALMAGLQFAKGKRIVFMDGDLQHPPSLLPLFFGKMDEGFDLVSGQKLSTADSGGTKRLLSGWFYRLINFLSDTPIDKDVSDFRVFNQKVASAILQFDERELFLRGIFNWIGFKTATIGYNAPARRSGHSKYSFSKMIQLALRGTLSFSFKPIRLSLLMGSIVSVAAFLFIIFAVISYFAGNTIPGWASIIIGVMFLGGIQLIMIGLIGEYVASLFMESKKRPLFLIDEKINVDPAVL